MSKTDLEAIAFPRLSDKQLDAIDDVATLCAFPDGAALFEAGDTDFRFFVVRQGAVEIVESTSGRQRRVTIHHEREFTGDIDMLTGRSTVVSAIAHGNCEVYMITAEELRRIIKDQPTIGDMLLRAFLARRRLLMASGFIGVQVIGSRYSVDTNRIRDFLSKNRVPFTWIEIENDPRVDQLIQRFHIQPADLPMVICANDAVLRNPSNRELGECLHIKQPLQNVVYDLAIIGGGPAGLAAAVYGSSEGLNTVVLEKLAPGGQAGSSSKIENYMGFPTGLSGNELASRAVLQAQKFGAVLTAPVEVVHMDVSQAYPLIKSDDGETVVARCVLIATGAAYRKLNVPNSERFEGQGVHYGATLVEAQTCAEQRVIVVGGGNSAGQAAVFLAAKAHEVFLLIRGGDLLKSMSAYLVSRIEQTHNIHVHTFTEICAMHGAEYLEQVTLCNNQTNESTTIEVHGVFIFIGAVPHTTWLPPGIATDGKGFIVTGPSIPAAAGWPLQRSPFLLETSCPGIFAAGDVRAESIKRVASAVGEGSMAVHFVHRFLSG